MILGIYHPAEGVGHDTGVALITEDGQILAAHSEERFSRVKMDGSFPFRAFDALQKAVRFTLKDLSCVAVPFMSLGEKVQEGSRLFFSSLADPQLGARQARNRLNEDRFQKGMASLGAYGYLQEYVESLKAIHRADGRPSLSDWRQFLKYCGLDSIPLVQMDHHLAHAAGAYYTSGWDQALVLTCDGIGALKSGIVAVGKEGRLQVISRTFYPHSPGGFWEAITAICGFHHMKHGGKITALAAYGEPEASSYQVMEEALSLNGLTIRSHVDPVRMANELRGFSREDIAATAQRRLEEVVTGLIRQAAKKTALRRVALAGGVFANVKLNQRIAELEEIDEVYIYPAMGDEGLGLGAALYVAGKQHSLQPFQLKDVYFGPAYDDHEIEAVLEEENVCYQAYAEPELASQLADLLARGKVVGLFRGRMEFGPRALGHRTILSQATDRKVNLWLNERLGRTEFMPFAPVTLEEHAAHCYREVKTRHYAAQFMTINCDCTDWMKQVSPGVVHLDGTARPQLISKNVEPFYYDVLCQYHKRAGIPSLINTSFNMHEEPMVCSPREAVHAFRQGKLDALAIGRFLSCADDVN
ncbi:MAG TPA: carbamoyltransferase C-terminal domain-containing protein [Candidatus Binatia bacterium]|nr:carbamoyltransferase C-terminal domain-containing protein [Candidatus Binatia bacterium]